MYLVYKICTHTHTLLGHRYIELFLTSRPGDDGNGMRDTGGGEYMSRRGATRGGGGGGGGGVTTANNTTRYPSQTTWTDPKVKIIHIWTCRHIVCVLMVCVIPRCL